MKLNNDNTYSRFVIGGKTLTLMFLFMLTVASCSKEEEAFQEPLSEGSIAPEFTLKSSEGTDVKLSDFDNKVVVLFFFGNSCPSCKAAAPNVESMLVTPFTSNTDYMVLGLDQWDGNAASVEAFKAATGVSFPLLLNASGVATDYKTTYDRLVVIDKTGKIVFSGTQGAANDIETVKTLVMELTDPVDEGSGNETDMAPDFSLKSLDGTDVKLSDFDNKVVVLFFFGNSCPSCKAAAPSMESMLVTPFAKSTDYMVLGLDQWDGNAASVEAFKAATGVSFPLLLEASGVAADYKTTFDRLVVIDKTGKIVFSGTQSAANDIEAVKTLVMELTDPVDEGSGNETDMAPDFSLKSLDGTDVKLSDFDNKVVVLFFFGNSCPSCKAAAPNVESMLVAPFAKSTDYMVLGLDQWDGNAASVEAFKAATGVSFPLLLEASGVAADYETTFDRLVVIDKTGKIVFSGTQSVANDIEAVKTLVMELADPVDDGSGTETDLAPDFSLKSLDGTDVKLSDFDNKVVVLFFFGNSCPSCKAAAPSVESMLVTPFTSNTDYMVLGLDQWDGNTASVEAFKAATGVSFPLLLDASGVASDYKTTYDRLVVIDKTGKIVFSGKQGAAGDIAAVKAKVEEIL